MSVAGQFAALPMESLIGGPLNAAATAQGQLASITSEFIQNIGLQKDKDGKLSARTVDFHYEKPVKVTDDKGAETWTKVPMDLTVPLLTIVKAPNLQVKEVNVQFDVEVKTSSSSSNETKKDASVEASWSGWGAKVKFNASVSNTQKSQRSSDTSAKYHVDVKALDEGAPEGLMKVLDILQEAIQPSEGASK